MSSSDLPEGPLITLHRDVLLALTDCLGPRSLKRLSSACHYLLNLYGELEATGRYPRLLATGAIYHLEGEALRRDPEPDSQARRAAVREFVRTVTAILSGSRDDLGAWTQAHLLSFLYPASIHLAGWALGRYALEWCARNERSILGGRPEPREELLALLYPDAMERLAALAKAAKWATGAAAAEVGLAVRRAAVAVPGVGEDAKEAAGCDRRVIEVITRSVLRTAFKLGPERIPLGLAMISALRGGTGSCESGGLWLRLGNPLVWDRTLAPPSPEEWRHLAGIASGGEPSPRNPDTLLKQFLHPDMQDPPKGKRGRLRPDLLGGGVAPRGPWHAVRRVVGGHLPRLTGASPHAAEAPVRVPDPGLGKMIADSVAGAPGHPEPRPREPADGSGAWTTTGYALTGALLSCLMAGEMPELPDSPAMSDDDIPPLEPEGSDDDADDAGDSDDADGTDDE
jgi:hypothetical protein